MGQKDEQEIDYDAGFRMYTERFAERFGERPAGAFVKFGRHMVKSLDARDFKERIDAYVRLHRACKRMLETGSTISDALVLDFDEAAAWVSVQAPNVHAMFRGEMGDPRLAAPVRPRATLPGGVKDTDEMDKPPGVTGAPGRKPG